MFIMRTFRLSALLFLSCLLAGPARGQSLIEDTEALVAALQSLKSPATAGEESLPAPVIDTVIVTLFETPEGDSLARDTVWGAPVPPLSPVERAAQAMAILYYYDTPTKETPTTLPQFQSITRRYAGNPMIRRFLGDEELLPYTQLVDTVFARSFREKLTQLQSSPRQKMMSFLQTEEAVTPSAYLSVSRSLQNHSRPALEGQVALRKAAGQSNRNVADGLVSAPAIIEGLFNFVLSKAQEEVAISFLERLLSEDVQLMPTLFPTVSRTFKGHNFTYSTSFIERLRTSFYEDMQLLPVRLPELIWENDYFLPLKEDPVAYNLLVAFYTAGLAQKGMALDSFLPITHRYLYDTYEEARKKVDQDLVSQANTPEYQAIIGSTDTIIAQMKAIHSRLVNEETALRDTIRAYKLRFGETASLQLLADDALENPDLNYSALMSDPQDSLGLGLLWLPDMLRGRLNPENVMRANTLEYYDKFFAREYSPNQWRSAGLSLARNLNGSWRKGYTIPDLLRSRRKALADYAKNVRQWILETDPEGARRADLQRAEQKRVYLGQTLLPAMQSFWGKDSLASPDQLLALRLLDTIVAEPGNFYPFRRRSTLADSLAMARKELTRVEERLFILNERLERGQTDNVRQANPMRGYLASQQPSEPFTGILAMIDTLSEQLQLLDRQFKTLDRLRGGAAARARDNAEPILQTTDILAQLFFCLRSPDEENKWITREQLSSVMDGGLRQQVFFGLMQQRLLDIRPIGRISPNGLAQLVELTIQEWPLLDDSSRPASPGRDPLEAGRNTPPRFYRKAALVMNTFNRILELPLLSSPEGGRAFIPLVKQDTALSVLPDLSRQALDLIYFLGEKDHRHAVSSSIRLFSVMDRAIGNNLAANGISRPKRKRNNNVVGFFRNYGDFVADLIDADSTTKITALMNGIADPPGSSRLKRNHDFSVTLNAYLGGAVYHEWWDNPEDNSSDQFFGIAPTIPIGVNISGLFFGRKKPSSFSAFLSFLDLGSLFAYTDGGQIGGDSKISFKNVFKPGLQFHWNIPKSPFYLGVGAHYGPQFLDTAAGDELSVRSFRFSFLNFGLDIPIKTFYWSMN